MTMTKHQSIRAALALVTLAAGALLALAACSQPIGGPAPAAATGSLRITDQPAASRSATILPPALSAALITTYRIEISGQPAILRNNGNYSSTIPDIPVGPHQLVVFALDAANQLIGQSEAQTITISALSQTNASVSIMPLASGTGTLAASYDWPAGLADAGSLSLVAWPSRAAVSLAPGASVVHIATHSASLNAAGLPAGNYLATLQLSLAASNLAPVCSLVQICGNLVSSAGISLNATELTSIPAAPTNLRIGNLSLVSGAWMIGLLWDDNSNTEQSWQVYKDGTLLASVSAGTTGFAIPLPASAASLEVRAGNAFGESTGSTLSFVPVSTITVSPSSPGPLNTGASLALSATVAPANASLAAFATWKSNNPAIAGVSAGGTVTGITAGNTNIFVQCGSINSLTVPVTVTPYTAGDGSSGNPWQVNNAAQLAWINTNATSLAASYRQMTDIASLGTWTPIGSSGDPFAGVYDGNGKQIGGMNLTPTGNYAGLFGYTNNATIKDLTVGGTINSSPYSNVGGLAGTAVDTDIDNCHSSVTVTATSSVGGLVGNFGSLLRSPVISNCSAQGAVFGSGGTVGGLAGASVGTASYLVLINGCSASGAIAANNGTVGGLLGTTNDTNLTLCSASGTASIVSTPSGSPAAGGLVGEFSSGTITKCFATGKVDGYGTPSSAGGLVGFFKATASRASLLDQSYATGAVINGLYPGGLAGYVLGDIANQATVQDCWANGSVRGLSANYAGGLVGADGNAGYAPIRRCLATGLVYANGAANYRNLVGTANATANNYVNADQQPNAETGVSYATTQDLLSPATWITATWDMASVWTNPTAGAYPNLVWQAGANLNTPLQIHYFPIENSLTDKGVLPSWNGSLGGSATPAGTTAKVGSYSANLTSAGSFLTLPSSAETLPASFSLSFWVYFTAIPGNAILFSNHSTTSANGFHLGVDGSYKLYFVSSDGSSVSSAITATTPFSSTLTWYHVGLTRAADGKISLFVNKALNISQTPTVTGYSSTGPFRLSGYLTSGSSPFTGYVDEVRFFSRALNLDEMAALP
jgi:hypothetical protein